MTNWIGAAALSAFGLVAAVPATAQDWYEPARGSDERRNLMDAVRPHVEWRLGAPVEFVVEALRTDGDVAFALLSPQRPGGAAIDINDTPMVQIFGDDAEYYEETGGLGVVALMVRAGTQWAAVDFSLGATDAWFSVEPYCTAFLPVLDDYCGDY